MMVRSGTGTRKFPARSGTPVSGPVFRSDPRETGLWAAVPNPAPVDRAPVWFTTPRDSYSGKPGTPVRGPRTPNYPVPGDR